MREEYLDGTEIGGYCRAVRHGNLIFVSGTGGIDAKGVLAGPDVTSQTKLIYEKIERSLAHFGASLQNVVRICVYVTDLKTSPEFAKVHAEFFKGTRPTSTLIEVSKLAAGMSIEIEAQAVI